jgi:hypothetical protein
MHDLPLLASAAGALGGFTGIHEQPQLGPLS